MNLQANFEQIPLKDYAERAYLDYSMYVVLDRALPFVGDGLKPVQRRIIYAMNDLGLNAGAKPRKCALAIGEVLGKYHPHGDSACYEAMVLMAQPFSYRYPLVERPGQLRLARRSEIVRGDALHRSETHADGGAAARRNRSGHGRLHAELRRHARQNHRGCRRACRTFCSTARPASPSAWRPTFRRTTCAKWSRACIHLLDEPEASIAELCRHIKGPDFPTAAEIITPKSELEGDVRDRQRLGALPRASTRKKTATSSSPRCRIRCRRRRSSSRSPTRCARRNCRCSKTCATNPITKIPFVWC